MPIPGSIVQRGLLRHTGQIRARPVLNNNYSTAFMSIRQYYHTVHRRLNLGKVKRLRQCCGGSGSACSWASRITSGSISHKNGSGYGSFYHQAEIVRNTLISTVSWLLCDFLTLKNDVNHTCTSVPNTYILGLPDPDPLVISTDPAPDRAPDPSIIT
jgi:hypothetical protein